MRHSFLAIAIILFFGLTAFAQTPGKLNHFDKDGLKFDYTNGWTLTDASKAADVQQLTLERAGSDAQIRVFTYRLTLDTPEKFAQARAKIIDPYVESTANIFVQMGATPTRTPDNIEIAGAKAEGTRIGAVLDGQHGEAAIYWLALGNRLVVLTFFGPDAALKQDAPTWDTVRSSIRVEVPAPANKTAPK